MARRSCMKPVWCRPRCRCGSCAAPRCRALIKEMNARPMKITTRNRGMIRRGLRLAGLCAVLLASVSIAQADDLKDGKAALQAGRLDDALKSFEKAASQGLAAGRAGVGQVWLRRRQYDKAMEAFQLAQKMDGQFAWSYYGQGEVLRR